MAGSPLDFGDGPRAEINVTPLVDVMLVLLVIFMVTAPMMQQGVDVNLPKASSGPISGSAEQVVLSIDKTGSIFLGSGNKFNLEAIGEKVKSVLALRAENDRKIYIKADTQLDYGKVMEVIGALHRSGVTQIGLISAPVTTSDSSSPAKKGR